MSTLDEDYFSSTWQVGCDWLVKTAGGHEPLIQSFKNIINSEVSGLNGRVPRSDLLWSAASKLWSEVCGDDQLGERRPALQGLAAQDDMLDFATVKNVTAAPYKTVDELIYALMKVPAAKRHQFTFSCRLPESTHGGLANSVWAKHLSPTISTQTSAASPPQESQSEQANTAKPDIQTSKGPGLKPTVAKAKTKKPQATAPVAVAVQDLPSLGNPPAHPVDCDSYEVKLPRGVRVANRVEPYIGTLNKILGIILQVVKKQNAVQIKTHQARSNRGLSKELIDFDNEYKARRAYDIFLRWAADMYRGGEPKDLLRFVAEAMGSEADEMRDRCKEVARFIDQKMNLQCQGAAPAENPENSHLPTLERGDAMSKHNGHLELMPETRRIQINNLRTSPSVQVKWEHQDVSSALIDEPRHNSPESRDELEQRVNDIWELATYDEDLEFLGDMRSCRDGFEELGSQMLRGQIHMPYFFERMHATFFQVITLLKTSVRSSRSLSA
ncbi:hypothetical protein PG999_010380 [Apiospora kogelbergensis]|uniref:Uncharacterized protein n=1 Tax=Apiospora kogelbergensis TaxID=1337665 RepID=A0AAW0QCE1_9PEZI